jgi:alpha-galactosidase
VSLDDWGRPTPRIDEYPSAATSVGFSSLAAKVHALGLLFGVWTVRGIPKAAVELNLPIANSSFTASDAWSNRAPCNWSSACYGCATDASGERCNEAAYAYYRSLAQWYKEQGIDYVKMDCMFPAQHYPQGMYDPDDWAITQALREQGLFVSLSPGRDVSVMNGTWVATTGLADQYRSVRCRIPSLAAVT